MVTVTVGTEWALVSAVLVLDQDVDEGYDVELVWGEGWSDGVDWIELAEVQVEQKDHVTALCHGDAGGGYAWGDGGPHAAPSTRQATTLDLDAHLGLVDGQAPFSVRLLVQAPHDADGAWPYDAAPLMDLQGLAAGRRMYCYYSPAAGQFHVRLDEHAALSSAAQPFAAGDWLDLLLSVDLQNGTLDLYVDGLPVGSAMLDLDAADMNGAAYDAWRLGADAAGESWGHWALARLTVFDRALSAAEVTALCR